MLIIEYNSRLTHGNYGSYEKYVKFTENCIITEQICFMTKQYRLLNKLL